MDVTPAQIQKIIPRTPLHVARAVADGLDVAAGEVMIHTPRRMAAFIAQAAFETCGFSKRISLTWIALLWRAHGLNALADAGNHREITRFFDAGLTGYGARLLIQKQALRVLTAH